MQPDYINNARAHLCWESAEEPEPEVAECESEVLVEEVPEELGHAEVGPAPVHQQEALQVPELGQRKVAGQDSLHALLATDAHTDVGHCKGQ